VSKETTQCGYHGFLYGSDGARRNAPSISPLPAARLRTFALVGSAYLWIWLGDPARITDASTAAHRLDRKIGVRPISGRMEVAANYLLLKENVLDLTHFGFVHATTFRITDWVDPPRFTSDRDSTGYRQEFRRSPLPAVRRAAGSPRWAHPGIATTTAHSCHRAAGCGGHLIDPQSGSTAGGSA
jgi:vanillate O-demethylase monooxygenase subunit